MILLRRNEIVTFRNCPCCGYIVSQEVIEHCTIDFDCPRCGKHKHSEFKIYETEKEDELGLIDGKT